MQRIAKQLHFLENRPNYYLVQYSRGTEEDNFSVKLVPQKKIRWPEHADPADCEDLEVKIKDGRSRRSGVVLYGHKSKQIVREQLERLKTQYFDKLFDEMDFEFTPVGDPWLLLQYADGTAKLTHCIVRLSETTQPADQSPGSTAVSYNDGVNEFVAFVLRKSHRREELLRTLMRMMIESQIFNFPKSAYKKFKDGKHKRPKRPETRDELLTRLERRMNFEKATIRDAWIFLHGLCKKVRMDLQKVKDIKVKPRLEWH